MRVYVVAAVGMAMLALAGSASAGIVGLTNTNQIDLSGVTLGSDGVPVGGYALNLVGENDKTVCGVTFKPLGGPYTVPGASANGAAYHWSDSGFGISPVAGTDGDTMMSILNSFFYDNGANVTMAVTPGKTYTLQLFGSAAAWPDTSFDVDISATPGLDGDELFVAGGKNYLYTTTFTANASTVGVTLYYGSTGANNYPVMAAALLTEAVPEPATMSLMALGSLAALSRRRK